MLLGAIILLISGVGSRSQQLDLGPADGNLDGKLSHRELARVIRLAQQRAHDAARAAALPAATAAISPIFDAGRPDAAVDFVYPDFVFDSATSTVGGDRSPAAGDGALRRRMDDHMWAFADVAPADGRLSRAEFLAYMRPALAVDAAAYERLQAERRLLSMAYLDGARGGTLTWQEFKQGSAAFGDGEGVGGGSDDQHAGRQLLPHAQLREAFDRCGRGEGLERGLQSDVTVACFAALTDNQSAASQAAELLAAADADGDLLLAPDERVLSDEVRQRLQALLDAHRDAEAAAGQHGELR